MKYIKKFDSNIYYKKTDDEIKRYLMDSINFANQDFYEYLIEIKKRNISLDYMDYEGDTPLCLAVYKNRCEKNGVPFIEYLIRNGADVNFKDISHRTPLIIAAFNDDISTMRTLIEFGADWYDINNRDNDLIYHISEEYRDEIIQDYPEKYKEYLMLKDSEKYNL